MTQGRSLVREDNGIGINCGDWAGRSSGRDAGGDPGWGQRVNSDRWLSSFLSASVRRLSCLVVTRGALSS